MQINLFSRKAWRERCDYSPRKLSRSVGCAAVCVCGVSWTIISYGCLWGQSTEKVSCYLFFALTPRCLGSSVCSFYLCYLRSRREAMNQRELILVRVGSVPQDQWLTLLVTETKLQKKRRYFVSFTEETLKRSEQSW